MKPQLPSVLPFFSNPGLSLAPIALAALMAGCGGGSDGAGANSSAAAPLATGMTTLDLTPVASVGAIAQPSFHVAAVLLDEPSDAGSSGASASARLQPHIQAVPGSNQNLSTRRLTAQVLNQAQVLTPAGNGSVNPQSSTTAAITYNVSQVRAAYGFAPLPAAGTTLTAAQAAQFGAGQTIYLIDAHHNPNAAAELSLVNQRFGVPTCASKAISPSASLPLPAPAAAACELSVVYSTTAGAMSPTAPTYDSGWATEISLDVQWAHAIAPLARIVLIEAPTASTNDLSAAIKLANAMGPGVVSMSFGAGESSGTSALDSLFATPGMSYFASAGDSGAGVSWPAVSPKVVAVGGTSLTFNGTGSRSEVVWSGSGGGVSQYVATPSYQTAAVPGVGTLAHRAVSDVAFNADPYTGQYIAVIPSGSSTANWLSAGGTSMSSPQWAALTAVANAMRVQAGRGLLGQPHSVLYGNIATVAGQYASNFADITKGADGTCATCAARTGFDFPTGLGTPNAASMLAMLSGVTPAPLPPTITAVSITGNVGTPLSFSVQASGPNGLSYALGGAPAGMTVNASGTVSWPTPVAGSYTVSVTVTDTTTKLSAQAPYAINIAAPQAPQVTSAAISGQPAKALSFQIGLGNTTTDPLTYSLANAPVGMNVNTNGLVSWNNPVVGTYKVTAVVKDSKTGLSGQGVYTVTIANASTAAGPVITAPAINGTAGKAISGSISVSDPGAQGVSISVTGIPLGMQLMPNGLTLNISWANPTAGSYTLVVVVTDSAGLTAKANVPITIK
jgi:subtilase family serine protease